MTKIKIFQTATLLDVVNTVLFLTFGYLLLEFVSDFGFRISSLSGLGFGVQGSKVALSHLDCIWDVYLREKRQLLQAYSKIWS
jgi:hypothetical protein